MQRNTVNVRQNGQVQTRFETAATSNRQWQRSSGQRDFRC